ncbi:MAG: phosphotransferase family protein, partial [Lysobacteraceae bacterium]
GQARLRRVGNGHSCETFLVERGDFCAILRRAPRPPYAPGLVNLERENRILTALDGAANAPRVHARDLAGEVIGGPFLLLEKVSGMTIGERMPAALRNPADQRAIGREMAVAMAELHAQDVRSLGLHDISRPTIDHARHLARLDELLKKAQCRDIARAQELVAWLGRNLPPVEADAVTLVHSDFRLGNVLFAETSPARLTAVLDWETTMLGDPLVDLGFLVGNYREHGEDDGFLALLSPESLGPGAMTRREIAETYADASGRPLTHFNWYLAFALFRTAAMGEGLYRRYLERGEADPFFEAFGAGVPEVIERALTFAHEGCR